MTFLTFWLLHRMVPPFGLSSEKIVDAKIFEIFKMISKNGLFRTFLILEGTKSWKISPFGASNDDCWAIIDQGGKILPPPCKIGLNKEAKIILFLTQKRYQNVSLSVIIQSSLWVKLVCSKSTTDNQRILKLKIIITKQLYFKAWRRIHPWISEF